MKKSLMVAGFACLLAAPVAASDGHEAKIPRAQLFGGYSLARDGGENAHGFAANFQFNLSKWLAVGVETSRHSADDHGASVTQSSYLAGPRLSLRRGKIVPFVYALAGIERISAGVKIGGVSISESESENAAAFGGGIDFELSHKWALAIEVDKLFVRSHGSTHGTMRFGAGVAYSIGEK